MGASGIRAISGVSEASQGLSAKKLTTEQEAEVQRLRARDQEVRQHEQAHLAVAGSYARGGGRYSYTTGPDGKQYATGGEVSIDTSPAGSPEATVRKMEAVKRAAVAPGNPSAQDRAVYAQASRTEMEARLQEQQQSNSGGTPAEGASVAGAIQDISAAAFRKAIASLQPEVSSGGIDLSV
jgi:hypothetical protein